MVIYFSPGDYHRFHSPVDMSVRRANHILGQLYPVKLSYISTHQSVYESNERLALFAKYHNNSRFLSLVFVGATNVGSISLSFHPSFNANFPISLSKSYSNSYFYDYLSIYQNQSTKVNNL